VLHIEQIQDQVELALMRGGHHQVARAYVPYREEHARARATAQPPVQRPRLSVHNAEGEPAGAAGRLAVFGERVVAIEVSSSRCRSSVAFGQSDTCRIRSLMVDPAAPKRRRANKGVQWKPRPELFSANGLIYRFLCQASALLNTMTHET
jgi:hypothetical protein